MSRSYRHISDYKNEILEMRRQGKTGTEQNVNLVLSTIREAEKKEGHRRATTPR